jgi:chromosome segregation ATPase
MTPEDLQAIRAIIREEIAASEQRITHATAANLSDLREEIIRRIEELSRRIETLERRFEILAPVILSVDTRMGAFTRAVDQLLTTHDQTANTVTAQQRAIDQLVARVTRIERELHPEPPQ